jgi:hypothetical protein
MNGKLLVGCSLPGAALFGGCVANAGHSSTASPPGPAAAPPPATAAPTAPVVPTPAPIVSAPAPVEPNGPQTSFTDGQWVVGEEVVPGTYRSPGPADGPIKLCYVDSKGERQDRRPGGLERRAGPDRPGRRPGHQDERLPGLHEDRLMVTEHKQPDRFTVRHSVMMRRLGVVAVLSVLLWGGGVSAAAAAPAETAGTVSRVVDGDTVHVTDGRGSRIKVRVLGIDTPETVDRRKPVGLTPG